MTDIRTCEQCGGAFAARREHARFCGARCRAAWNRRYSRDTTTTARALLWSVTAMTETIDRIPAIGAWDPSRAIAAIGEAVWQVTLVDATLVRHHPDTYDRVMAAQTPIHRELVEATLGGLRFVRNHIGREASLAGFIQAGGPGTVGGPITDWTWKPAPEPPLTALAPRGRPWELARYQAYQGCLADQTIGRTFSRAASFLNRAAASALSIVNRDAQARW